jgi:serine/threonine-protein kinase
MTDPEDILDELLDRWEEAFAGGRDIPAEELCRDYPELLNRVKNAIRAFKRQPWMNQPAAGATAAAAAPPRFAPGEVIGGRYRLVARLADGAHGEVWRAEEIRGGRAVAVKLPRCIGVDADDTLRLTTEASKVLGLDHPNVVRVYYAGLHGDAVYVAFRLIDGHDLTALIPEPWAAGKWAMGRAVRVGLVLADVLDHAHRKG